MSRWLVHSVWRSRLWVSMEEGGSIVLGVQQNNNRPFDHSIWPVYVRLLWIGYTSHLLADKVTPSVVRCYNAVKVQTIIITRTAFQSTHKDVLTTWRCPWCNGYRRRKWTQRHEFKSSTRLTAFHIALIPLGKVWIQLFSLQLWVNSWADWVLQPWLDN